MSCTRLKACFTKQQAAKALEQIKLGKQYRKEDRTYYCEECKAWHLTSMPAYTKPGKVILKFKDKFKKYTKK